MRVVQRMETSRALLGAVFTILFAILNCSSRAQTAQPTGSLYVALGDSITAGTGVVKNCKPFPTVAVDIESFCPDGTSYPILVAKTLRAKGIAARFMNLGIPGATVDRVIKDELPLLPSNATLVTLYIGTNDSRQFVDPKPPSTEVITQFERQYDELLSLIRAKAAKARIVLINIPNEKEVGLTYHLSESMQVRFETISQAMDRFIDQHYPTYEVVDTICDERSYIVAHRDKGSVHPNELGAADLADAVLRVLFAETPVAPPAKCQWFSAEDKEALR